MLALNVLVLNVLVLRTKHFSPRPLGLLSLLDLRPAIVSCRQKDQLVNIAGAILFDALPRGYSTSDTTRLKSTLRLPNTVEFLSRKKARKKAPERRYKVRHKIETHLRLQGSAK